LGRSTGLRKVDSSIRRAPSEGEAVSKLTTLPGDVVPKLIVLYSEESVPKLTTSLLGDVVPRLSYSLVGRNGS
jgi:hypothetical protein